MEAVAKEIARYPGRWLEAHIRFVSLVKKAANKRMFLFAKSEDEPTELFVPFIKRAMESDDGMHYVSSVVYEPDTDDTDGQRIGEAVLEKAALEFMMNGPAIDIEHNNRPTEGVRVVESYLAKTDMTIDDQPVKKGSWIMTLGIRNPDVWEKIQNGDLTGLSMQGDGLIVRDPTERSSDGMVAELARWFIEKFTQRKSNNGESAEREGMKKSAVPPTSERSGANMAEKLTEKQFEDVFEAAYQASRKAMHDELHNAFRELGLFSESTPSEPQEAEVSKSVADSKAEIAGIVKSVVTELIDEVNAERAQAQAAVQEAALKKAAQEKREAEIKSMVREMIEPELAEIKKSFRAPSNLNDLEEPKPVTSNSHYLDGIL